MFKVPSLRNVQKPGPYFHDGSVAVFVDAEGKLVSNELPPDMLPDSDTTLETG